MKTSNVKVNGWVFLEEDEPKNTSYKTPGSSYASMVKYGVYKYTDFVSICWVNTLPTSSSTVPVGDGSTCTIALQTSTHPDGSSNLQYMQWLVQDARAANPNVKILAMLGYGADELSQIFSGPSSGWQQSATAYGNNVLAYLQKYDLDGFDVDWESPFSDETTSQQFQLVFTAIRQAFKTQDRYYYLTLSPAEVGRLDATTVNDCFDFVNLQLYSGFTFPQEFIQAGVSQGLLAYGAKFEPNGGIPYQNAQGAYQGYTAGGYSIATQWRLNSGNFQYEQAQQMILYQLAHGISGTTFDDSSIVGAAGNPPITELVVRSGEVLDAIQATNNSGFPQMPYQLLQHGGNSGTAATVSVPAGDTIAEISGYVGTWFGWNCVLQITIKTRGGVVFGPFGTMANASSKTAFSKTAPQGQSIVALSGSIVQVPLSGGGTTYVIASLEVTCASNNPQSASSDAKPEAQPALIGSSR